MSEFRFFVDIEDSSGNKVGGGPLQSVSQWTYTARFDRAGEFSFTCLAADPQADQLTARRIVRAWALIDGAWTEVGAGVIDQIDTVPGNDGVVSLRVSGLDLIRELSYRSVGTLEVGAGSGTTHATALTAIGAYAPSGWTFTPAASPDNDYIYARFGGESVLAALVMLAERTQTHFYRSSGKTLVFTSAFTDSGIRAIQAYEDLADEQCAIVSLSKSVDTHDLLTRITPFGSGQGEARLTLAATNRAAPAGYTLNAASNYIENDSATTTYGLVDFPHIEFKDIGPLSNTNADLQAAANMLFDAALEELRRRSSLASQETYRLTVAGCSALLRPLQTIGLVYEDASQNIDIDADLYILETTWTMDTSGIATTGLVVSTDDVWPKTDEFSAAERAVQGKIFQAYPQIGPNSYWENATLYIGSDRTYHVGEFPFVLGNEVVTVQQVLFRYKVDAPVSFTTTVAASSTTSGASSTSSSAAGSSHTHTVTIAGHTHDIPDHQHTITVAGGSSPPDDLLISVSGGVGFLAKASAGDVPLNTNSDSGGTTSESGGSSTPTSSSESAHTHDIAHTHTVTAEVATAYGVYRADGARTYALDELEYRVNGGTWADLDTGTLTSGDYYEVDITADVYNSTTFRPLQENNLIEVRRKSAAGVLSIASSQGNGSTVGIQTSTAHGLAVGEEVIVTGTAYHNGVWNVVEVTNEFIVRVNMSGDSNTESPSSGSLFINKAAMVLAKLGVRNTIQAVAYL